jgi:hypothetical protein
MCDDVRLCNYCVRELLILTRTWFAFGLPSKTGCDKLIKGQHILGLTNFILRKIGFLAHVKQGSKLELIIHIRTS